MKHLSLFLLLGCATTGASPSDYVNFVRQTQFDTFVEWDVAVDQTGSMLSPAEVGSLGSFYELWSVNGATAEEFTLDQEFVSEYSPRIAITVETKDPYKFIPRTRVDQPLTVRVNIEDLASGQNVPKAATKLHFEHRGYLYGELGYTIDPTLSPEADFSSEYLVDSNGEVVLEFPSATLTSSDGGKTQGLEFFTISSYSNNNGHGNNLDDVDSSNDGEKDSTDSSGSYDDETFAGGAYVVGAIIEESALQVWPVAEASLSGIESSMRYDSIPPITVDLVDLYPDSVTYVRVYKGSPSTSPAEPINVGNACAIIRDSIPQDRTLLIKDLDTLLPSDGTYTLEVVHETPFGTDVLTQLHPLVVAWEIKMRGTIYSRK